MISKERESISRFLFNEESVLEGQVVLEGLGRGAQLVKCLLPKLKDLTSDSQDLLESWVLQHTPMVSTLGRQSREDS